VVAAERALHLASSTPLVAIRCFSSICSGSTRTCGLHHDFAAMGIISDQSSPASRASAFSATAFVAFSSIAIASRLPVMGRTHVRCRNLGLRALVFSLLSLSGCWAFRRQGLQLDSHDVQGSIHTRRHALRFRLPRTFTVGGLTASFSPRWHRRACHRHLFHRRALSYIMGRRRGHGLSRRHAFLVAQRFPAASIRKAGRNSQR